MAARHLHACLLCNLIGETTISPWPHIHKEGQHPMQKGEVAQLKERAIITSCVHDDFGRLSNSYPSLRCAIGSENPAPCPPLLFLQRDTTLSYAQRTSTNHATSLVHSNTPEKFLGKFLNKPTDFSLLPDDGSFLKSTSTIWKTKQQTPNMETVTKNRSLSSTRSKEISTQANLSNDSSKRTLRKDCGSTRKHCQRPPKVSYYSRRHESLLCINKSSPCGVSNLRHGECGMGICFMELPVNSSLPCLSDFEGVLRNLTHVRHRRSNFDPHKEERQNRSRFELIGMVVNIAS